jgi:hypothetical protein
MLRFMHLELFWVRILIPCALVVGVLSFFPAVFLREGYAGYVTSYRVLDVVPITSFLSSARGQYTRFELRALCLLGKHSTT